MRDRKILVVDDDPLVLESCRRVLEAEEYLVVCVPSAGDAFDNLEMGHFDLMIMDIKMPRQDGFYLLEKIKGKWPIDRVLELPSARHDGISYPGDPERAEESRRSPLHPEALHAGRTVGGSTKKF